MVQTFIMDIQKLRNH